jgi:peptide chain release factor subunit 1
VHEIRPRAEDHSLGHEAMLSIRSDIERIERVVDQERWPPGAIAMFSCGGRGFFESLELPRSVRDRVVVDFTPWVRALLAVLEEYHRCCVAVVDRGSAQVWELYQRDLREVTSFRDRILRNPPGLPGDRVRDKADELAKRHFRKVAAELTGLFRTHPFDLLAIGGHQQEMPGFISMLPRELRERFAGSFTLDPGTATRGDIRAAADAIVERYAREEERRLVAEVVEKVAAGGWAALGLDDCLWAASVAAVRTLLVQEGASVPGVICRSCGWLACAGDRCALCEGPARETPDVIDEMVVAVIDEGGSIRHIEADTALREHLVGAVQRFPLPPRPTG